MMSKTHARDYEKQWENLERTVNQVLQIENTVAVVIANDIEKDSDLHDNERVHLIEYCGISYYDITVPDNRRKDKTQKIILGSQCVKADYYMLLDADDYIHLDMVKWLDENAPINGAYVPDMNFFFGDDEVFFIDTLNM